MKMDLIDKLIEQFNKILLFIENIDIELYKEYKLILKELCDYVIQRNKKGKLLIKLKHIIYSRSTLKNKILSNKKYLNSKDS